MTGSRTSGPDTQSKIGSLQVLRFAAASLVAIGHFQKTMTDAAGAALPGFMHVIPLDWGVGVDIFFVISGFVMYFLSHDKFGAQGASSDFIARRIIRLVPLYWIFTTLVLLVAFNQPIKGAGLYLYPPNILSSYLFIPGPLCEERCFPSFSLGWTLNYEMLFYVLFAIGLMFRKSVGLTIIIGALALLMLAYQLFPASVLIRFWGYNIIGEFVGGIIISHLFLSGVRVGRAHGLLMLFAGLAMAVAVFQRYHYEIEWRLVTGGIPAALMVSGVVLGWRGALDGPVTGFLVKGGDASYALYLWHPFVMKAGDAAFRKFGLWERMPLLFLPYCIFAALAGAFLIHHYLELPLTRYLVRRFVPRRRGDSVKTAHSVGLSEAKESA